MSFFSKAFKAIKSVTKSKVFSAVTGGLAVVFPVVGVPLAAGVAIANKVTDGLDAVDPAIKAKATAVVEHTVKLANTGDVGAKRAVALFKIARVAKKGNPAQKAAAHEKLGRLAMAEKLKQAKAKAIVGQFALTRGGRIMHKKTRRNLAANYR